jgi:hypothetical protein
VVICRANNVLTHIKTTGKVSNMSRKIKATRCIILSEDMERTKTFCQKLQQKGIPHESWHLGSASLDLSAVPLDDVIYYNRISPSSGSRGHAHTPHFGKLLLEWLHKHNVRVINGLNTLEMEVSKAKQFLALRDAGISVPNTVVCLGMNQISNALKENFQPGQKLVVKPNMGGSGVGVHIFDNTPYSSKSFNGKKVQSTDGLVIIQEYVHSKPLNRQQIEDREKEQTEAEELLLSQQIQPQPQAVTQTKGVTRGLILNNVQSLPKAKRLAVNTPRTTKVQSKVQATKSKSAKIPEYAYRLEMIDHKPMYVLRMDTSEGVRLCPCDAKPHDQRFQVMLKPHIELKHISEDAYMQFQQKCIQFTHDHDIGICAFEFKINQNDEFVVYDLNMNTNYSEIAERNAHKRYSPGQVPSGVEILADYLAQELANSHIEEQAEEEEDSLQHNIDEDHDDLEDFVTPH